MGVAALKDRLYRAAAAAGQLPADTAPPPFPFTAGGCGAAARVLRHARRLCCRLCCQLAHKPPLEQRSSALC